MEGRSAPFRSRDVFALKHPIAVKRWKDALDVNSLMRAE